MNVPLPPEGLASMILIDAIDDDHVQAIATDCGCKPDSSFLLTSIMTLLQIKAGNYPCGLEMDDNDWRPCYTKDEWFV
jgi:hypothetical protein